MKKAVIAFLLLPLANAFAAKINGLVRYSTGEPVRGEKGSLFLLTFPWEERRSTPLLDFSIDDSGYFEFEINEAGIYELRIGGGNIPVYRWMGFLGGADFSLPVLEIKEPSSLLSEYSESHVCIDEYTKNRWHLYPFRVNNNVFLDGYRCYFWNGKVLKTKYEQENKSFDFKVVFADKSKNYKLYAAMGYLFLGETKDTFSFFSDKEVVDLVIVSDVNKVEFVGSLREGVSYISPLKENIIVNLPNYKPFAVYPSCCMWLAGIAGELNKLLLPKLGTELIVEDEYSHLAVEVSGNTVSINPPNFYVVKGVLLDEKETTIKGAEITAYAVGRSVSAVSFADGSFFLPALGDKAILYVIKQPFAPLRRVVGSQVNSLTFYLKKGSSIYGKLVGNREYVEEVYIQDERGERKEIAVDQFGYLWYEGLKIGKYEITVVANGERLSRKVEIVENGVIVDLGSFELERKVEFVIKSKNGEKLENVKVFIDRGCSGEREELVGTSDSRGRFLTKVVFGSCFRFKKDNYLTKELKVGELADEIDVVMEPLFSFVLEVVDAIEYPVVGVKVLVDNLEENLVTDKNGQVRIETPKGGPVKIVLIHPDYAPKELVIKKERVGDKVRVVLDKGGSIKGVVFNRNREPVSGVRVGVDHEYVDFSSFTSDDGTFTLDGLPLGSVKLIFEHKDYRPLRLDVNVTNEFKNIEVILDRGATLRIYVTDSRDRVVEGATVYLRKFADVISGDNSNDGSGGNSSAISDQEGRVEFKALERGVYFVEVRKSEFARKVELVRVNNEKVEKRIRLDEGVDLVGRITGVPDDLLKGVKVVAKSTAPYNVEIMAEVSNDVFTIRNLGRRPWIIEGWVEGSKYRARKEIAISPEAEDSYEIELHFKEFKPLEGVVRKGGDVLEGVMVKIVAKGGVTEMLETDRDGKFRASGISGGYLDIFVYSGDRQIYKSSRVVEEGAKLVIEIPSSIVEGKVLERDSYTPVKGARVTLNYLSDNGDKGFLVRSSSGEGNFFFDNVPAGKISLYVSKRGFASEREDFDLLDGEEKYLEILLSKEAEVSFVIDGLREGTPVNVAVLDKDYNLLLSNVFRVGKSGDVVVKKIPQGEWIFVIQPLNYAVIKVQGKAPGFLGKFSPSPMAAAKVMIKDFVSGVDQGKVRVKVYYDDGSPFLVPQAGNVVKKEWTIIGGIGYIQGMPPGFYSFEAYSEDGNEWRSYTKVDVGSPSIVRLQPF